MFLSRRRLLSVTYGDTSPKERPPPKDAGYFNRHCEGCARGNLNRLTRRDTVGYVGNRRTLRLKNNCQPPWYVENRRTLRLNNYPTTVVRRKSPYPTIEKQLPTTMVRRESPYPTIEKQLPTTMVRRESPYPMDKTTNFPATIHHSLLTNINNKPPSFLGGRLLLIKPLLLPYLNVSNGCKRVLV